MINIQLLDKTRKINKLLHDNDSSKLSFCDISNVLSDILDSHIYVISKKGKVLGICRDKKQEEIEDFSSSKIGKIIDKNFNERLLSILSTKENANLLTLGFDEENANRFSAIVTPINMAGERLGTLFIYKENAQYEIEDIILSEYGTTVVGLEMLRSVSEENAEEERNFKKIKSAIGTLSFSELEAVKHVFDELEGQEGMIVASKIADRAGITRSVIVNAIRKFVSAGVIEAKSSGMKGTYIKVLNENLTDELKKYI